MNTQPSIDLETVTQLWADLLPYDAPDRFQTNLWLRNGVEVVVYAIEQVAIKRIKLGGDMTRDHAIRLCGSICCGVSRQKQHNAAQQHAGSLS